jgi:hypothetical protein
MPKPSKPPFFSSILTTLDAGEEFTLADPFQLAPPNEVALHMEDMVAPFVRDPELLLHSRPGLLTAGSRWELTLPPLETMVEDLMEGCAPSANAWFETGCRMPDGSVLDIGSMIFSPTELSLVAIPVMRSQHRLLLPGLAFTFDGFGTGEPLLGLGDMFPRYRSLQDDVLTNILRITVHHFLTSYLKTQTTPLARQTGSFPGQRFLH